MTLTPDHRRWRSSLFFGRSFVAAALFLCRIKPMWCYGHPVIKRSHFAPLSATIARSSDNDLRSDASQSPSDASPVLDVPILYESDRVLAINKPANVSHHDENGNLGIVSLMRQLQSIGAIGYSGRLYGVHRLDRVTSGILLFAKDAIMASELARKFREGSVIKYYVGVSCKKATKKQGWVRGNMTRGRRRSWKLMKQDGSKKANFAETRFYTSGLGHIVEFCNEEINSAPKTCILFRPYTGKTHQLRVAAKSVGMPLLGDLIYRDGTIGLATRTCLHAAAIHIETIDDTISVWSPPSFGLWKHDGNQMFEESVHTLMRKHCDAIAIREQIRGL